jgi:1-pyrroline-5-carboxylate dehydrogenase
VEITMANPGFENELTLDKLKAKGREEEFHRSYESAYEKALKDLDAKYKNAIGPEQRGSKLGEFSDTCPYDTSLVLGKFPKGTREDVADAVRISQDALESWEQTKVSERCSVFLMAADKMAERKCEFAAKLTLENGKNRFESIAEVDEAIDYLRYYPSVLREREGYVLEMDGPVPCNETKSVLRPLGVLGVISPFNFPIAITTGMVTGALVTGNAAILKPASDTPLMGRMLHDLLIESGVPPEIFHFIAGPGETVGTELTSNRGIAALVFTGSRDVGTGIIKSSADLGKRPPIVEMGGKNPTVVSDKADLKKAVEGVGRAAFGYAGQKCSATSRVIVNRAVADKFTKLLCDWLKDKRVGDPSKRDVFVGPVINKSAVEKFRKVIASASKDGQVLMGGHVLEEGAFKKGFFVEPTVVVHLARNHELVMRELFLPILVVLTYSDLRDAVDTANSTEYGLTAGIFSDDPGEVQYFFDNIKAGVTYANRSVGSTTGALVGKQPFVGWKSSGVTGKGAGGPYYLLQFLQEQSRTVCR